MSTFDATTFHARFDELVKPLIERARDTLIETVNHHDDLTATMIEAQMLMNLLDDGDVSVHGPDASINGKFSTAHKVVFLEMADHMGPDWVQALYHAARFMTRVA